MGRACGRAATPSRLLWTGHTADVASRGSAWHGTVFASWLGAYAGGDTRLEAFESARFRPEFKVAFDAWLATRPFDDQAAPSSPFVMPDYQLGLGQQANKLEQQATALFDQGVTANQRSDRYVLNTVVLAIALFFAGIASRFTWRPAELAIIGLAIMALAYGLADIVGSPIH